MEAGTEIYSYLGAAAEDHSQPLSERSQHILNKLKKSIGTIEMEARSGKKTTCYGWRATPVTTKYNSSDGHSSQVLNPEEFFNNQEVIDL